MNFRTATFDGAISISAIQWLCSGVQSAPLEAPPTFAEAAGAGTEAKRDITPITVHRKEVLTTTAAKESHTEGRRNLQPSPGDVQAGDAARLTGSGVPGRVSGDETRGDDPEEEETQRNTQIVMFTAKPSQKSEGAITHTDGGGSKSNTPYGRLRRFFTWLYASLRPGARAALQFYPDSTQQVETITAAALRAGFNGGLVVDYPNSTKAKKHFLVLWVGGGHMSTAEQQLQLQNTAVDSGPQDHVLVAQRERQKRMKRRGNKAGGLSRRQWIMRKKEKQRLQLKRDLGALEIEKAKG